jgi:hypothetical protein
MNLSTKQVQAIENGEAVPITIGQTECVVIRKMAGWDDPEMDVYDRP